MNEMKLFSKSSEKQLSNTKLEVSEKKIIKNRDEETSPFMKEPINIQNINTNITKTKSTLKKLENSVEKINNFDKEKDQKDNNIEIIKENENKTKKVTLATSPMKALRKKPASIITAKLNSLDIYTKPKTIDKESMEDLQTIKAKKKKSQYKIKKIKPISSSNSGSEEESKNKVILEENNKKTASVCVWTDSDLPKYDYSDFSAQFGPEIPSQARDSGIYMMSFNPNNIYGLKGDKYYHTTKSIFSAHPLIPELSSSYVFAPPFHISNT